MRSQSCYVVNESTLIHDDEVVDMAYACNVQLRDHVAPAWRQERVLVRHHEGTLAEAQEGAAPGSWVIAIMDAADQDGVLGWHSEDDAGRVYGEIFAKPSLDSGSSALDGPYAVSSVLSHEVIETFGDRYVNQWTDTGNGFMVATELCDPVEADGYKVNGVQVSNFVLPAWFDAAAPASRMYDYLGKTVQPFSMSPGGYWVQMGTTKESEQFKRTLDWMHTVGFDVIGAPHEVQAVFSPEMPAWRKIHKLTYGRNIVKRGVTGDQ